MEKYNHAVEKLTNVLECLVTHPGDVSERVVSAYALCAHLKPEELPAKCQSDWIWIENEIGAYGFPQNTHKNSINEGFENDLKTERKATSSKIARKFYEIYWEISGNKQYN